MTEQFFDRAAFSMIGGEYHVGTVFTFHWFQTVEYPLAFDKTGLFVRDRMVGMVGDYESRCRFTIKCMDTTSGNQDVDTETYYRGMAVCNQSCTLKNRTCLCLKMGMNRSYFC